jgi:hypothetical protein
MICPNCLHANREGGSVCVSCGRSLAPGVGARPQDPVKAPPRALSTIRNLFRLSVTTTGPDDPK